MLSMSIFYYEKQKSGYYKEIPYPKDVEWLSREESDEINQRIRKIGKRKINNLFQMILLYDNIIIPSFVEWDDYSKLEETGYIKIYTYDDMQNYMNGLYDDFDYKYGQYIKSALITHIKKMISNYNYCKIVSDIKFTSIIYDLYIWSKVDTLNFNKLVEENLIMLSFNDSIFDGKIINQVKFNENIILNYLK